MKAKYALKCCQKLHNHFLRTVFSVSLSEHIHKTNICRCVRSETAGVPPLQEPDDVWRLQTGLHAGGGTEHWYQCQQRQTLRETSVCYGHLQG